MLIAKGKVDCEPSEVGYDGDREEVLLKHFQKMIDKKEIQCASYCVARKGKVILNGAIGPRSYEEGCKEPLQPDSVHETASITKVFTATAIMQLIENGYARLDTFVGEILPQFATPPYDKVTLFQLLSHTSGIHPDEGTFEDKYYTNAWEYIENAFERAENKEEVDWIAEGLKTGFRKEPGIEWQYCSFGFAILGAVIEKLSGQFANDYIEEHILKPLHMDDSGFYLRPEMARKMIYRDEKKKKRLIEIAEGGKTVDLDAGTGWEKIPDTAGGMISSAYDMVRFANMMLGKGRLDGTRILGRKTVEKMTTYSLHNIPDYCWGANEPDRQYGVGFDMRTGLAYHYSKGTFMHEGSGACSMIIDPAEEMAACWFVPFCGEGWYSQALYNVTNIIWSGLV